MSASFHGGHHVVVPITSLPEVRDSPPVTGANLLAALQRKFKWATFVLGLLQILWLIIALSLWQTGNKSAGVVVLCVSYFSSYFLTFIGCFVEVKAPDLNTEVKYLRLLYRYTVLKLILVLLLACIYLQREIVPDLWVFGVAYVIFLIMTLDVIKTLWKLYKEFETMKIFVFILIGCVCFTFISLTIYFGLLGSAYATTSLVQMKLPIGALFVPIFFGQIANNVMIVMSMTQNLAVIPEASMTDT